MGYSNIDYAIQSKKSNEKSMHGRARKLDIASEIKVYYCT